MSITIENITAQERQIALSSIDFLTKNEDFLFKEKNKGIHLRIANSNQTVEIPFQAFLLLKSIISNVAAGNDVILLPTNAELTTQQTAELLNVSRPDIVKLLETGKIPFHKVGSHRRIKLKDALAYEAQLKQLRKENLQFLVKEAQELNLGRIGWSG